MVLRPVGVDITQLISCKPFDFPEILNVANVLPAMQCDHERMIGHVVLFARECLCIDVDGAFIKVSGLRLVHGGSFFVMQMYHMVERFPALVACYSGFLSAPIGVPSLHGLRAPTHSILND